MPPPIDTNDPLDETHSGEPGPSPPADPPALLTLIGVVILLLVGVALGIVHNAFGLAGRPPHGIAWVAEADTALATLESLDHGHPHPGEGTLDTLASTTARPPAETAREEPARGGTPANQTPASKPPAQSAPTSTPASPPSAAGLPVIPDVPGPIAVQLPTFKKLYDAGAVLVVDAREVGEYTGGHIAGATHLSYNDALAEPQRAKRLNAGGRPIVVYCSSSTCHLARDLAGFLVESGQRRVLVYEGGWKDWSAAGYPTARGEAAGKRP